ncbi:hypothetical protein AO380_1523 [Moraxella catarrhalis]|nr:hypothetical protein AO380_1523 [Moraxella catarrhalis]
MSYQRRSKTVKTTQFASHATNPHPKHQPRPKRLKIAYFDFS